MFHHAETLKKLISLQFLQCFVNVTLFRTRTETTYILLWNANNKPSKIDRKSIKDQSEIVIFESSKSDRVSNPISVPFWDRFGCFFGGPWGPLRAFRNMQKLASKALWPKNAQKGPKMGPRGPQKGPRRAPRGPQFCPQLAPRNG